MAQLTNHGGGDKHTPSAKLEIARREEKIVALHLQNISFEAIGRAVGVSKQAAYKSFNRALRRNADKDVHTIYLTETAKLDIHEALLSQAIEANKGDWKALVSLENTLIRLYMRRAKLLGLDAPGKIDISVLYKKGVDQESAESLASQRVLEALTDDEQEYIYEKFEEARRRVAGAIDATATVISGTDHRDDDGDTAATETAEE